MLNCMDNKTKLSEKKNTCQVIVFRAKLLKAVRTNCCMNRCVGVSVNNKGNCDDLDS